MCVCVCVCVCVVHTILVIYSSIIHIKFCGKKEEKRKSGNVLQPPVTSLFFYEYLYNQTTRLRQLLMGTRSAVYKQPKSVVVHSNHVFITLFYFVLRGQ